MKAFQGMKVALSLVLLLCSSVLGGIYYEQEMTLKPSSETAQPGSTKLRCYISGPKMRVETAGGQTIGITRMDTGVVYHLVPAQKVYRSETLTRPDPEKERQVEVTITKTQERRKIGQYACSRYDVTVGSQRFSLWITTDVDVGDDWATMWKAAGQWGWAKLADEVIRIKGFPIRTEMDIPPGTLILTVTTVKKQAVPDTMFEVPEGYKPMPAAGR